MPSHIGSYDGKGDPVNYLHLFEGAIRMQKWIAGSILKYEDLKAKFRSHFSQQKKFTKTHLAVHNIKQREGESTRAFATRYTDDTLQILGLHKDQCVSGFVYGVRIRNLVAYLYTNLPSTYKGQQQRAEKQGKFSPYQGPNNGLLSNLSKSPREILATEKVAKMFEQPPQMFRNRRSRDMTKYCHFHEDHGHDINDCRQLRNQIEEAVKSGQLSHLVKGIKKERTKARDTQLGEGKKDKGTIPVEASILMISRGEPCARSNTLEGPTFECREITFPLVTRNHNSSAPVIITAKIFERQVNQVYIDSGSSCEVIYDHCFLKLKSSIKSSKVDSKVKVLFPGRKPSIFVIVTSSSPHNLLHGRTTMQKIGIVVSTIHGAIKFHTAQGIGIVFSTYESNKVRERLKKIKEASLPDIQGILNCTNAEERVIINDKHPEQTVMIEKQLPKNFKEKLRNLLKSDTSVFAWTHSDMTGIPRTIMVGGKPFNIEHKLNEYSYIKPVKQKRRSLDPGRSTTSCKEVEELMKARILLRVKNPMCVANPGMVKKSDRGWRMCVDFTNINKACPKDCYPLSKIDSNVESLSGFRLKCFLDAYKGFSDQIGRNLEAYVDDMVIKSFSKEDMLKDIQETFKKFWLINMKLNSKKCSFGVKEGQFLGHLITKQGIRANPSKAKAVTDIEQPKTLKDIQSLYGKLAALNRFLSRGAERNNTKKEVPKDFLVELPFKEDKKKAVGTMKTKLESTKLSNAWKLYTDKALSFDGSGAGLMIINPKGKEYTYALHFEFETTNNEVEYEALLAGLQIAKEMEIESLAIFADSQLMVNQIKGAYEARQPTIKEYLKKTKEVMICFDSYTIEHIQRNQNKKANALSKLSLMTFEHLTKEVLVKVLAKKSIDNKEVLHVKVKEGESWMTPIYEYLLSGLLPEDPRESRKIRIKEFCTTNPSSHHGFVV
ncbi:reverse transcriptase domain-containing protein [Tanacetum coccineum]